MWHGLGGQNGAPGDRVGGPVGGEWRSRRASGDPRSAISWDHLQAARLLGRAPTCSGRRSATPGAAAPSASTRYTDLLQLKVIKQLLDAGVSLRSTRKAIECLRASGASVASASLSSPTTAASWPIRARNCSTCCAAAKGVLSIVLGMDKIVSEVDAAIMEIEARRASSVGHPSAGPSTLDGHGAATGT